MTHRLVTSIPGTCRDCKRRREVFSCQRRNGGTYRTAPRWRSSSICAECAIDRLSGSTPGHDPDGWGIGYLTDIVFSIDTDEAREVIAAYEAQEVERKAHQVAEDIRMRPFWDRVAERREIIEWVRAQQHVDGMDVTTCQAIAGGVKRGEAGNENTGAIYEPGQPTRWERTIREQVTDYLASPDNAYLDEVTRSALVTGINIGLHRPATPSDRNQDS